MRSTAMVVSTGPQARGGGRTGVELVVDVNGTPTYAVAKWKLDGDRLWLVTGQELPVEVDPSDPARVEPVEGECRTIEERIAARDASLVDPLGARSRVAAARAAGGGSSVAAGGVAGRSPTDSAAVEALRAKLEEERRRAAELKRKRGKRRGVALKVGERLLRRGGGRGLTQTSVMGVKAEFLLAVHLAGEDPYAVKTSLKVGGKDHVGDIVPVLVDEGDRSEIKVDWEENDRIRREQTAAILGGAADAQARAQAQLGAALDFLRNR